MIRYSTIFLLSLLVNLGLFAQTYHSPSEVLKIMEASALQYQSHPAKASTTSYPRGPVNSAFTFQEIQENGSLGIGTLALTEEAASFFDAAEEAFKEKKYTEAIEYYGKVLDLDPEFSIAATYVGQCHREAGDLDAAAKSFQLAIEINYHDYLAHWLLADVHLQNKDKKLAMREITLAWILNRNHPQIKAAVATIYKACGKKFDDFEFEPRFEMQQNEQVVQLFFEVDWLMYVYCKALWRFEPNYHEELGGGRSAFEIEEEKECLLNVVIAHDAEFGKKKSKVPAINAVIRALDQKMLNPFIFMEIWIPQEPLIVYTQPMEAIEELADYVLEIRVK